jgi:phosphatidylglycerophosphate synthase
MSSAAVGTEFREAGRELGVTGSIEKRALLWLAARMPAGVGSDHLTALGFASTLAAGLLYAGSASYPWMVLLVNVALVANWFGDSLDGTLARFRGRSRPRYGFYADHLVDSIGVVALVLGLSASGLMASTVAAAVLVAYLLLSIETYLATYTLSRFKIAHGGLGGTELRIALAAVNVGVYLWPGPLPFGARLFDVVGVAVTAALAVAFTVSAVRNSVRLRDEETPPPALPPPTSATAPRGGARSSAAPYESKAPGPACPWPQSA